MESSPTVMAVKSTLPQAMQVARNRQNEVVKSRLGAGANRLRRLIVLAIAASSLAPATAAAAETSGTTRVVDGDRLQCANAGYTSIQSAVDEAAPGDVIRICPDVYDETVTVDKPLTLWGDPDALEAEDCFSPAAVDPARHVIVDPDPVDGGFSVAFKLRATDIVLEGIVVRGASVGIDTSDAFSGYRIHHNLVQANTLFGLDFGSEGTRESRVDHNCIRDNRFGLVSELDDDSNWPFGPVGGERTARDLYNARIDHNASFRTGEGVALAGPGRRDLVTLDHNVSRDDGIGIALQNSTRSVIVGNEFASSSSAAILVGGANEGLEIRSNIVRRGNFGVQFRSQGFVDFFAAPNRKVIVADNDVRDAGAGIVATFGTLVDSLIAENTTSGNARIGINMLGTGNIVRSNISDNNGLVGINALVGATGNRFEHNSMHGNAVLDARDLNPLVNGMLPNVWIGNDCETDFPAGAICGVG